MIEASPVDWADAGSTIQRLKITPAALGFAGSAQTYNNFLYFQMEMTWL